MRPRRGARVAPSAQLWAPRWVAPLLPPAFYGHLAVLRPRYASEESARRCIEELRQGKAEVNREKGIVRPGIAYDNRFSLKTDDRQYCTEFLYKGLRKTAPEIHVKPSNLLGFKLVNDDDLLSSPDIDLVYNSGSNFWLNHLSQYD